MNSKNFLKLMWGVDADNPFWILGLWKILEKKLTSLGEVLVPLFTAILENQKIAIVLGASKYLISSEQKCLNFERQKMGMSLGGMFDEALCERVQEIHRR